MNIQHKAFSADVEVSPDEPRTLVITASTAAVDREGEVLIPQGCNSKNWEKNPVIHFNHRIYDLPVGTGVAIKRSDDAVRIKLQFVERPPTYPANLDWFPDTLFWMYQKRAMRGASVGFTPLDGRIAGTRDKSKYGDDCEYIHNRWELLELTLCPIGMNQEALADAVSKGIMTQETADKLFKTDEKQAENTEKSAEDAEKQPDTVEKAAPADDEADLVACEECEKEFPEKSMIAQTPRGDGGVKTFLCESCHADLVMTIPVPEAKVHRRVVAETTAVPAKPKAKRIVHHIVDAPAADVRKQMQKMAEDALAKRRGRIFLID